MPEPAMQSDEQANIDELLANLDTLSDGDLDRLLDQMR
jgi:hypothetical protein